MAKETKQERVVRGMSDQVTEHIHDLKNLSSNPATKELDLERWCQSVLKSCLGFTATNGYSIRSQETRGKLRPDLIVFKDDKPICVIEVKKLGYDLDKSDLRSGKIQLTEYLHSIGTVSWGILSNGYEWRLYEFSPDASTVIDVLSFDLRNDHGELDISKRSLEDICWNLADLHESTFASGQWHELAKEATAFSPDSLARAILSADAVKYIAKAIRGEFDYRANTDVLFDKLRNLLENGLDDLVRDWNETKQSELNKYVYTQKRAGRKKRVSSAAKDCKDGHPLPSGAPSAESPQTVTPGTEQAPSADSDKRSAA
jgi:hypothetical protein